SSNGPAPHPCAWRLQGAFARDQTDSLHKIQIRIAGLVELEHRVARSRMPIRQSPRRAKFHARVIDIGERSSGFGLDQEPQPHRWRKYPMLRFRLRARRLGRERPKHGSISAVVSDAQFDRAQLVANVAQLPQRFDLRIGLGHALERLAAQVELAGLRSRPVNSYGRNQTLKARSVKVPFSEL